MDKQEWLNCTDRDKMLRALRRTGSDRKRRLVACALCRRIWHLIEEGPCRQAVEASERYADKEIGDKELVAAQKATWPVVRNDETRTQANLAASRMARTAGVDETVTLAVLAAEVEVEERKKRVATTLKALRASHCDLIRCVLVRPDGLRPATTLSPAWRTPTVLALATAAYNNRHLPSGHLEQDRLTILADALEEVGCQDAPLLEHLRGPGPHVRGCFAVDLLLGRS